VSDLTSEELASLEAMSEEYRGEAGAGRKADIKRRLLRLDEIGPVLSVNYLVKSWITVNGLSVLFGPSNAGKTFVALGIAMHVASGEPWMGCKVNPGPVLYIAAEGGAGVLNRLAAFKLENPHMAGAPFTLLPIGVDLHASGDAKIIAALLKDTRPALIVVDTLARSIGEGDENTAKDTAMFVRNCDLMRELTGAHVMIIHHTGKDEDRGARGSSALRAAVDTEILVSSAHSITSQKQRDMVAPDPLHFTLRSVRLGFDEDGDPVTSAVMEQSDKPVPIRKPLTGKNQVAMTALTDALRDYGQTGLGGEYPTSCQVVAAEHWRDACAAHGLTTGASEAAGRVAFKRAKDKLVDLNEVREFNGHVWKVRDDV
jgi:AAA domain